MQFMRSVNILIFLSHLSGDEGAGAFQKSSSAFLSHLSGDEAGL